MFDKIMNTARSNSSYNTSAVSSQNSCVDDMDTNKVKNYVKDVLKSRIFLGRYLERRLTDQRIGYRDVVLVSAAETELKRDLLEARQKLQSVCPNTAWIGITAAEPLGYQSGICLWTEIDNQPFGPFWFQIRSVKFRNEEVIVTLKCIRHISDAYLEIEPILTGAVKNRGVSSKSAPENRPDSTTDSLNDTFKEIGGTLKGAVSIRNIKEFVTFIFAFIIALFTGSTAFINFIGNFVLALIREMSIFIKNSTPMFLGVLDFFSKIVGGFYILLAMFFRPSNPVPQNRRAVGYYDRQPHRSNNAYDDKSFD